MKKTTFNPGVLVCHEDERRLYFNIPDEKTLHRIALQILTERLESRCWYYRPNEPKDDSGMTREQIAAMPDGGLKSMAARLKDEYERTFQRAQAESKQYEEIVRAVTDKDGAEAWRILRGRSGEYERIELARFETEYRS